MRTKQYIKRMCMAAMAVMTWVCAMAQAQAYWPATVHDFGTFKEEVKTVTCTLTVENRGDSALVIKRVQPTCGCTATTFTRTPIAPGKTGFVELTYSAIGRPGDFSKDVFVYTNGEPRKSVLTIKGLVIGSPKTVSEQYPWAVGAMRYNASIVPLGEINRGKTRMAYLSGYNTAADTMLVSFAGAPDYIIPHAVPDTVIPGGHTTATFYYDTARAPLWGTNIDTVQVTVRPLHQSDTAHAATRRLDVTAFINEDFSHLSAKERAKAPQARIDAMLDLGTIQQGDVVERELKIENMGDNKLELRRISALDKGIDVTTDRTSAKKGKHMVARVKVDSSAFADKVVNSRIMVITNDPITPRYYVKVVGIIKQ